MSVANSCFSDNEDWSGSLCGIDKDCRGRRGSGSVFGYSEYYNAPEVQDIEYLGGCSSGRVRYQFEARSRKLLEEASGILQPKSSGEIMSQHWGQEITDGSLSRFTLDIMLAWECPSSAKEESYLESTAKGTEERKEPLQENTGQMNDYIPLFYPEIMSLLVFLWAHTHLCKTCIYSGKSLSRRCWTGWTHTRRTGQVQESKNVGHILQLILGPLAR